MVTLAAKCQPANDSFANRTPITADHLILTNTLSGATAEAGEPMIPDVSSGQTAWWTWTAPSNGLVSVAVTGMASNASVTVYAGNDLPSLSLIASNVYQSVYLYCGPHWRERPFLNFHAVKGQAYQLAVDSAVMTEAHQNFSYYHGIRTIWTTNVVQGGEYKMSFDFTPAPQNDDFHNRTKIAGPRVRLHASNVGASKEVGEPVMGGNPGGSSVWFSWKAPASGRVLISTNYVAPYLPPSWGFIGVYAINTGSYFEDCGEEHDLNPPPAFSPIFGAYTGTSVDALTSTGYLPFTLHDVSDSIIFDVVKGQNYEIAFDGNMGTAGAIDLYLMLTTPAANDSFATRIKTHGIGVVATGYNAGATHRTGEPILGGSQGKNSWWSWVAPVTGRVLVSVDGSDFAFPVGVFTGSTVKSLKPVQLTPVGGSFYVDVVAGCTYQFAVGDLAGLTGGIRLSITAPLVEAKLIKVVSNGRTALLTYAAPKGETLLFQKSIDGDRWVDICKARPNRNGVVFAATPAPARNGPHYRAIVVDL